MADDFHIDTFKGVISVLLGTVSFLGSFWFKRITGRIDKLEADLYGRNERISILEMQMTTIVKKLDRIEELLLERR